MVGTARVSTAVLAAALVGAAVVGALTWGEVVHASAARRARTLPQVERGDDVVIVVLGFRDGGRRANIVNRWRARIAVRTARRVAPSARAVTIVCSGGAVRGRTPEATLLRQYILGSPGWTGSVLVEQTSTSTWENVRNVQPVIEQADRIIFASNGLHAEKAREYLRRQRPDLSSRLARAVDYVPGEMTVLKPLFAAVGLRKLRTLRSGPPSPPT
ncbi:YdcF family protein [Curtobacterium sp. MCPF17_002]|uniref:YdcF family protein n=1 Tax=Curtobacterium sp. MCPF17_002 TaxID=2175645 RepID=UPI0021ABAE33|nr:YdcF family protein [Curtobacterium sp. MCPF17_002]WIB77509.1 YdcF family protein [Curtobacterium sp. MCPF17_002]